MKKSEIPDDTKTVKVKQSSLDRLKIAFEKKTGVNYKPGQAVEAAVQEYCDNV